MTLSDHLNLRKLVQDDTDESDFLAKALSDSRFDARLINSIYDRLDTGVWIFDFDEKRIIWANNKALEITGAPNLTELRSRDMGADMSHSVEQRLNQYRQDFNQRDVSFSEIWTLYPKGKARVLQVTLSGIRLNDGRMAMLAEARDHHEQQPETLRSAEALMHTTVMISLFAMGGSPLYRNTAARAACVDPDTNFFSQFQNPADIQHLKERIERDRHARMVAKVRTNDGDRWHELTVRPCSDVVTSQPAYLVSEIDVTELHETKERAQYLASHDALTGLSNRTFLTERLSKVLAAAAAKGLTATLYLVDLDDFKLINDTMGHAAGDSLLQLVANRLKEIAGPNDIVARLGGDEFLICHLEDPEAEGPGWFGKSLLGTFSYQQIIDGRPRNISLSIGYSHYPDDGRSIDNLIRNADLALYQAKREPKEKCVRFKDTMRKRRDENLALKKDLERAIREDEFVLYFQPIAFTKTNRTVSAEALIRWLHPEKGLIAPDQFIPLAEDTGLINEIGAWVCRSVAQAQARFQQRGLRIAIAMNVSPWQLSDPEFTALMMDLPDVYGCDPSQISLEITENVVLGEIPDALTALKELKNVGYSIVIDDFGTGYSNLAYLYNYPIDGIKIDRVFMNDISTGGAIVKLILSLADALGASVVAEGVETVEQRNWLSENGCHQFQGYLYSKPIPEDRFIGFLEEQSHLEPVASN
ncbi:putative bifunctional diguanylate cyclase/phosphodiesterase [Roseibium sp.]|uniref:putative bifunctional diguanylate cyclase/phosphodiesterase n=1 Tax=Roseibium sp. TaxID=1936156 RepID=UPI003B52CF53